MSRKPRRLGTLMLAATVLTGVVGVPPALAQDRPQVASPPRPHKPDTPPWWAIYLVMLIVAGLVGGVNFIPSKRGHQD